MKKKFTDLSHRVIGAAIEVHRHLGPGLLESTYQQCLARELHYKTRFPDQFQCGTPKKRPKKLHLLTFMSFMVKPLTQLKPIHEAQLLTYMKLIHIKQGPPKTHNP